MTKLLDQDDYPKSLANLEVRARRIELLNEPRMRRLKEFVDSIRLERPERTIPNFDPLDGGVEAECLFVLEAPGAKAGASDFISRNNNDNTAANWFRFNQTAGIARERTITWNIVPWYIGSGGKIRAANRKDIEEGLPYLLQLIDLLPELRVVVWVGRKAARAAEPVSLHRPDLKQFEIIHPSNQNINRDRVRKIAEIEDQLREVSRAFVR